MAFLSATVFLTATLLLAVGVDVHMNNKDFAESFTGRKLKEYGGFEYGLIAYEQAALASNKTAQWVVQNVPIYLNQSSEVLAPYAKLGRDLTLIAINVSTRVVHNLSGFVAENYPAAEYWYVYMLGMCLLPGPVVSVIRSFSLIVHMDSVRSYFKVEHNLPIVRDWLLRTGKSIGQWTETATDSAKIYGANAAHYLRTNVFVGNLSPENLHKLTMEAINSTQVLATNTMSWLADKVQNISAK